MICFEALFVCVCLVLLVLSVEFEFEHSRRLLFWYVSFDSVVVLLNVISLSLLKENEAHMFIHNDLLSLSPFTIPPILMFGSSTCLSPIHFLQRPFSI